jgi:rRNA maturation RNase YbeY
VLLDDAGMARANAAVFGRSMPTDVISLAYPPLAVAETGWTGEVLINAERAAREGARRPGGIGRELALYLAHGCQHLSGADDAAPRDRRGMRRRENAWLAKEDVRPLWMEVVLDEP